MTPLNLGGDLGIEPEENPGEAFEAGHLGECLDVLGFEVYLEGGSVEDLAIDLAVCLEEGFEEDLEEDLETLENFSTVAAAKEGFAGSSFARSFLENHVPGAVATEEFGHLPAELVLGS